VSQGHPRGPEGAVAQAAEDRVTASKKYVMEYVKRDLKYGETDAAYKRLTEIGLTPKEANRIINNLENPQSNLSGQQRRKFNAHANDAEREDMSAVQ
jgi:5-bromo-4-chloroindolyl phosphate hydrolysis protein